MDYAMICNNRVVEVLLDQNTKPKWPPTVYGEQIIAVECDNTVERGMMYNPEAGTFAFPYTEANEPIIEDEEVSVNERLNRIETMLNTLTADTVTTDSILEAIEKGVNEV